MARNPKSRTGKKRIKVEELPVAQKRLTKEAAKKVKGGLSGIGVFNSGALMTTPPFPAAKNK